MVQEEEYTSNDEIIEDEMVDALNGREFSDVSGDERELDQNYWTENTGKHLKFRNPDRYYDEPFCFSERQRRSPSPRLRYESRHREYNMSHNYRDDYRNRKIDGKRDGYRRNQSQEDRYRYERAPRQQYVRYQHEREPRRNEQQYHRQGWYKFYDSRSSSSEL